MRWYLTMSVMIAVTVMAGCAASAPPTETPIPVVATATSEVAGPATVTRAPVTDMAPVVVEAVTIRLLESFPIRVEAVVTGSLPDACAAMSGAETRRSGDRFVVTLAATRPAGEDCAPVVTPFEQIVSLDVMGLSAGPYTVSVNGIEAGFVLPDANAGAPGDSAITTGVEVVRAIGYARIYSTPDATSPVVALLAPGKTVRVTGQDPLRRWWRVVCPDGIVGDCWLSAGSVTAQAAASGP